MRTFKHRRFQQWMKSEGLTDKALIKAVEEMNLGLHDGNLGSGLYKKRLAMPGKGKRGSYRTLLAFRSENRAFFIYGFAKNTLANINEKEKSIYKKLSKELLILDESTLKSMIKTGSLIEVK